jgi:hypothetical protein
MRYPRGGNYGRIRMRFFGVETLGGKIRIVAEAIGDLATDGTFTHPSDDLANADKRSEEELLATSAGRRALKLWREGDDSQYERVTRERDAREQADDEARLAALDRMSPDEQEAWFRREFGSSPAVDNMIAPRREERGGRLRPVR